MHLPELPEPVVRTFCQENDRSGTSLRQPRGFPRVPDDPDADADPDVVRTFRTVMEIEAGTL
jgi:hypothetical protein